MTPFEAYRKDPTAESLMALLRAHQDGVYTVCLHVLRHPHDAEDAAQETLLKIAGGAKDLREPRAFKSWLYRLAYRTAVDYLRRRDARRRSEEGRTAMTPAPLSDEAREAIHEAMAALPDDDRLMLVEHYFEKATIEELGRREGISDVAMGKRLEKAKEKLKRRLAGAGILLGVSQVSHALESVTAVTAPSGLIGSAIASKAALVAAGGLTVSTKSAFTIGLATLLVLLLAVGAGVLYWSGKQSVTSSTASAKDPAPGRTGAPTPEHRVSVSDPAPARLRDAPACRNLLARFVSRIRSNDINQLAWEIHRVHDGGMPMIEEFVREFSAFAGADVIPIAKAILADSESDAVRFLISIVLGRSGSPAALDLLKGLAGEGTNPGVAGSSLYSIGLLRTPEGFAFLQELWAQVKKSGGPVGQQLLLAIGLQGAEGLAWLLEEIKTEKIDKVLNHQGVPWSFSLHKGDCLAFVRGVGAFDALRRIYESESDPELREGAARGMASNLASDQVDYLASVVTTASDPHLKWSIVFALIEGDSPSRTEFADRVLAQIQFPSGDRGLDQALIRLSRIASKETADVLYERFLALAPRANDADVHWDMGAIFGAVASRPGAEARIAALMKAAGFSDEQRGVALSMGLYGASPETAEAISKPVMALVQGADPKSSRFSNCLQALLYSGIDERLISSTLQEVHDRCTDPVDRLVILQELVRYTGNPARRTREPSIPQTFLATAADRATDAESLLYAAYCLTTSRSDALSRLRGRIGEWIGPDMKWAEHASDQNLLTFVAPAVIGDYYSRFGSAADIPWLRSLPDTFPFPAQWSENERSRVKSTLQQESRRAVDAIRMKS